MNLIDLDSSGSAHKQPIHLSKNNIKIRNHSKRKMIIFLHKKIWTHLHYDVKCIATPTEVLFECVCYIFLRNRRSKLNIYMYELKLLCSIDIIIGDLTDNKLMHHLLQPIEWKNCRLNTKEKKELYFCRRHWKLNT